MPSYTSPFTGNVIQPTDVSYAAYNISADLFLEWPVNGTVTYPAARVMQISATNSGRKVYMPPANQISVGQDALILNTGSETYTVVDNDGNTIISIAAGKAEYIFVTDNSTAAGVWGIIAFGVGTSSPDAATLAGKGLVAIANTLNQSHPASSITSGYTFSSTDRAQTLVWDSGTGTATLPLASSLGNNFFFLFKNAGSGTFTISTTGIETIDGGLTKTFQPNDSAMIICNGTTYYTIGYGISNQFFFTALTKNVSSGTYTLNSSEASATIDEYVGTLTGDVTIVYPALVSFYVVANLTTAGIYKLYITTGISGSNLVEIPPGQTATVFCDGTKFYNANTVQAGSTTLQLNNGTALAPSLSFSSETSTGIYRPSAGNFGISILGSQVVDINATGLDVTGTMTATNYVGINGGTF